MISFNRMNIKGTTCMWIIFTQAFNCSPHSRKEKFMHVAHHGKEGKMFLEK